MISIRKQNPVDVENVLTKGAKVKAVLRYWCWIANGKFGCGWQEQDPVKFQKQTKRICNYDD